MKRNFYKILSILFLVHITNLYAVDWANARISSTEREALIELYNNTNGDNWTNKNGWNGSAGTECTWYGVRCNQTYTSVQRIRLHNNNLIGTIPAELGNLTNLQYLAFSSN
jgi:hypothetical protein